MLYLRLIVSHHQIRYKSVYKKPLNKQPSTEVPKILETSRTTRKELRNFRQIAHCNRYLLLRKTVPKQREFDIALEFNSY